MNRIKVITQLLKIIIKEKKLSYHTNIDKIRKFPVFCPYIIYNHQTLIIMFYEIMY